MRFSHECGKKINERKGTQARVKISNCNCFPSDLYLQYLSASVFSIRGRLSTFALYGQLITVEVEGTTIHYQKQSFWEESEFSEILENKEEFENVVIQCLKEDLSRYGERGEYAKHRRVTGLPN